MSQTVHSMRKVGLASGASGEEGPDAAGGAASASSCCPPRGSGGAAFMAAAFRWIASGQAWGLGTNYFATGAGGDAAPVVGESSI